MGTTVDGLAVVSHHRGRRGALGLTDAAARTALDGAGLTPDDVDLLINVGIYHDRLLGEPALAALIQEDIGAHPEDPHDGDHGTFSFDVANGACGLLTGLRVAHGFLAAGTIRHALVVAGDANPGRRLTRHFPFAAAGAALACGWADGPAGVSAFAFAHRPAEHLFRAQAGFVRGHNRLLVEELPGFSESAGAWAGEIAARALREQGLRPEDVDVVIANPLDARFLRALREAAGLSADQVVAAERARPIHTAGLAVAWDEARRRGRLPAGATALLVSAGAGLTAGAAVLRVAPAAMAARDTVAAGTGRPATTS